MTKPAKTQVSKASTDKAPRVRKPAQAKIVDNQAIAQAQRDGMKSAIAARVSTLIDKGQNVAVEWARIDKFMSDDSFVNSLALLNGALDIGGLTAKLSNAEKVGNKENYVQAKTVEKCVRMIHSFALRDLTKLDDYQQQVVFNVLYNGSELSMRAAQASLSKRVECEGLKETIKGRANYSVGTASAQASQVREVLRVLGIASVNKGKRDDVLVVNPDRVAVLREVFAMGE